MWKQLEGRASETAEQFLQSNHRPYHKWCKTRFVFSFKSFSFIYIYLCSYLWSACLVSDVELQQPISPTGCATTSGPDRNKECKFPFVFRGVNWNGCTVVDEPSYKPWCATERDKKNNPLTSDGNYFTTWGYCKSDCRSNQGWPFLSYFSNYFSFYLIEVPHPLLHIYRTLKVYGFPSTLKEILKILNVWHNLSLPPNTKLKNIARIKAWLKGRPGWCWLVLVGHYARHCARHYPQHWRLWSNFLTP